MEQIIIEILKLKIELVKIIPDSCDLQSVHEIERLGMELKRSYTYLELQHLSKIGQGQ